MDFNNQMNQAEAYRQGQKFGFAAGIIASAAAYYLFQAYKPKSPIVRFKKNIKDTEE